MLEQILNYKFIVIVVFVILILGFSFFKDRLNLTINSDNQKKVHFNEEKNKIVEPNQMFIPTDNFQGKKDGYVFKSDSLGVGYYLDK
jgi:hypothetical protein